MGEPMEIDPVDDGPTKMSVPPPPPPPSVASANVQPIVVTEEDEARQAIEILRGDDVAARVSAANKLEAVAAALGEQRTREELLPFLTDGVDDEDEVLVAVAIQLGKMVDKVGGPAYAHTLLPPLELLLTVEEGTVRDAAVESTKTVTNVLSPEKFQSVYFDMLSDLMGEEWFTARMSASTILASAYSRFSREQQESLIQGFSALCRDDTPMVRRVASQQLGPVLQAVAKVLGRSCFEEGGTVVNTILPLYEELASNEQPDSVRLQTTENCVAFGAVLQSLTTTFSDHEMTLVQRLLPLIVATIDDRSWRVRWTAASKFANVIAAYDGIPQVMDSLIPAYEKLLQDPEAEVRTAATFNLAAVGKCKAKVLPPPPPGRPQDGSGAQADDEPRISVPRRLVKRVTNLTEDDSEHVRAALAMVATELAPILGKDATISHLVPPVLLLLRDPASEVRLNLISSLSALNEVIGVDLLSQSLLPAILDLAQDGKWRIRLAIIKHIPLLAKQLGRDFFSDKLSSICVGWLGDDIASIRTAAAQNLMDLTELFGTEWATEYLLPSIANIRHHDSYLRRLTAVQACSLMSGKMESTVVITEIIPIVLDMANDPVANIRFNVAQALSAITPVAGSHVFESQVQPVLNLLIDDEDRDVRYFALKTMEKLEQGFDEAETG